jgi:hypothetical protein
MGKHYFISNRGFVVKAYYTKKTNQLSLIIIKPSKDKWGYLRVFLSCNDGKRHCFKVHRLVGENFLPLIEGKDWINHKDGNKENNRVSNLEWCTPSENNYHAYNMKLSHSKKCPILCKTNGIVYDSISNASKELNISRKAIYLILQGEFTSLKGLTFEYYDKDWKNKKYY